MSRSLIPWRRGRGAAPARAEESPFDALHREMTSLFDSFFRDVEQTFRGWPAWRGAPAFVSPSVEVSETDDEVRVTAELPGLTEKDVEVSVDNDVLILRGEKKQEREEKKRSYHLVERAYGRFEREIPLPAGLDLDKVEAKFKNGVLTVVLPKTPEAKSQRRVVPVKEE